MQISVFGTGYVGLVTGACLADLGHKVICVDIDEQKIKQLGSGEVPFFEPGLKELVTRNVAKGRLRFSTDSENGVYFGEVIFNCVGTPQADNGAADLNYVYKVAEIVAKHSSGYKLLINKSTVPPGTAQKCMEIIQQNSPNSQVEICSNPEFLAEGKAVHDFTHPDKIVVGAKSDKAFSLLRKIYTGRVRMYIPVLETDWETAEMIKYANNAFLATKVSMINELANICDQVGADIKVVAQAMGMDYRISPKFLSAGTGYGGSCFPKDVRALIHTAKEKGYHPKLLTAVDQLNEDQKKILLAKLKNKFGENISGNTFTLWGLSFKPKTSDVREAPALVLISELLKLGVKLNLYDPIAMEEAKKIFPHSENSEGQINYCNSLEESTIGSSAIILMTEWDEFRNVSLTEIGMKMKEKVIFDGRNIYEPEIVKEEGFEYFGIGRR